MGTSQQLVPDISLTEHELEILERGIYKHARKLASRHLRNPDCFRTYLSDSIHGRHRMMLTPGATVRIDLLWPDAVLDPKTGMIGGPINQLLLSAFETIERRQLWTPLAVPSFSLWNDGDRHKWYKQAYTGFESIREGLVPMNRLYIEVETRTKLKDIVTGSYVERTEKTGHLVVRGNEVSEKDWELLSKKVLPLDAEIPDDES